MKSLFIVVILCLVAAGLCEKNNHDLAQKRLENSYDNHLRNEKHHSKYHRQRERSVQDLSDDVRVNFVSANKVEIEKDTTSIPSKKHDFYKNMKKLDLSTVPPSNDSVLMARYIMHNVDWAAIATLDSHRSGAKKSPFSNIKSISDGPAELGSGIPFFYLSPNDLSVEDLQKDNRVSISSTLAQTDHCRKSSYDPQDPRCARLVLSGKMKHVKSNTDEEDFARKALFSRHPSMATWPKDHKFYFAKLKIGQVLLLDNFGGFKTIDVEDYLKGSS